MASPCSKCYIADGEESAAGCAEPCEEKHAPPALRRVTRRERLLKGRRVMAEKWLGLYQQPGAEELTAAGT